MKTLHTVFALGLVCMTLAAGAQEAKVAFINSQRITSESGPAKAATAKLEAEFSKRQKELTDLQTPSSLLAKSLNAMPPP